LRQASSNAAKKDKSAGRIIIIVWDAVANTSVHETQKRLSGRAFSVTWRTWTREPFSWTSSNSHSSSRQSCQPQNTTNATKAAAALSILQHHQQQLNS
jgi:hypothetical protein